MGRPLVVPLADYLASTDTYDGFDVDGSGTVLERYLPIGASMQVSHSGMLAGWELDMHLIEILLPLRDPDGNPFPGTQFDHLARELTEAFGGVTAFTRSPAEGRWKDGGKTESDDIVVLDVMTERIDRAWWADLRRRLEHAFRQDEIVIRAQTIERL